MPLTSGNALPLFSGVKWSQVQILLARPLSARQCQPDSRKWLLNCAYLVTGCYLLAERALATGTVRGYVILDQPLPFLLWSDQLKY
jgi:hypothetical protein